MDATQLDKILTDLITGLKEKLQEEPDSELYKSMLREARDQHCTLRRDMKSQGVDL